jgi:hypothetical protein
VKSPQESIAEEELNDQDDDSNADEKELILNQALFFLLNI